MSDNKLMHEDSLGISKPITDMQLGDHNMIVYSDFDSLQEIYSSHTKRALELRNNTVIILYHYETKTAVMNALKELNKQSRGMKQTSH